MSWTAGLQSNARHTGSEQLQLKPPTQWGFSTPSAGMYRCGPPLADTTAHSLQKTRWINGVDKNKKLPQELNQCLPLAGVDLFGMSTVSANASSSFLPMNKPQHYTLGNMSTVASDISKCVLLILDMCHHVQTRTQLNYTFYVLSNAQCKEGVLVSLKKKYLHRLDKQLYRYYNDKERKQSAVIQR